MGKEVKIGLAVIGTLLVIFGYVAYRKIADSKSPTKPALADAAKKTEASADASAATVVEAGQDAQPPTESRSGFQSRGKLTDMLNSKRHGADAADPAAAIEAETAQTPSGPVIRSAGSSRRYSNSGRFADPSAAAETEPVEPAAEASDAETGDATVGGAAVAATDDAQETTEPQPTHRGRFAKSHDVPADDTDAAESIRTRPGRYSAITPATEEPEVGLLPADEEPQPIPTRWSRDGEIRGAANTNPVADADAYSTRATQPSSRSFNPEHAASSHAPAASRHAAPAAQHASPYRPRATHTSQPTESPYANGQGYNIGSSESTAPSGTPGYQDPSNYTVTPPQTSSPHAPAVRHGDKYEVQPNDSYWVISTRLYGTGAYFKALYEHNRGKYPWADRLKVGDPISAPAVAVLEQKYPDLCPRPRHRGAAPVHAATARVHAAGSRTYQVREGDTLFDIARYELGKASRWVEIYELNRAHLSEDFDYLPPGSQLLLPTQVPASPPYQESESYDTERVTTRPLPGRTR